MWIDQVTDKSSLGEKQEVFSYCWAKFSTWFHSHPTWRMREGEGFVGTTDAADGDYDGPHMQGGAHYTKTGRDFAFFLVDSAGQHVAQLTTDHPYWHECGAYWKSLHPLCRWGGDFAKRDYNHFSLIHAGKM